jgi:hypothetical protein
MVDDLIPRFGYWIPARHRVVRGLRFVDGEPNIQDAA